MTPCRTIFVVCATALLATVFLALMDCGEGGQNPCEKLIDIQKEICKDADKCFPCACILKNEGWGWIIDEFGIPDVEESSCTVQEECVGDVRAWAELCLDNKVPVDGEDGYQEWRNRGGCDPRAFHDIWLFDDNDTYSFPEFCQGRW